MLGDMFTKIYLNRIRCRKCGDIITSERTWDFKYCSCKTVAVDGGFEYLRRIYTVSEDEYEELSEYETDDA